MTKKEFIQRMVLNKASTQATIKPVIQYAEKVWQELSIHGYGDTKTQKERQSIDYYGRLTVYQKEFFDKFWTAFGLRIDKQGAAQSWIKLGELTKGEYQQIIAAAKAEAARPRDHGESRKYAQGWLSQRRFDDYDVKEESKSSINIERQQLISELRGLENFNDPIHNDRINQLKQMIAGLK